MALGVRWREFEKTTRWALPIRGVWNGINDLEVPRDALFDADNIVIRNGSVQGRPGIALLDAQIFDSRITGALNTFTTAELPRLVAGSLGKVWTFDYTSWSDRGGSLGGDADNPVRITSFLFGTPPVTRAYICNNKSAFGLKSWKDPDAALTVVTGSPPTFKDIATAGDRLIGLEGAHGIRWGDPLADNVWSALNVRLLSETPAHTTSIKSQGTLGVIVHKKDSIWVGQITGATGASAFCFSLVGWIDGAAGPAAVAQVINTQYYMTEYGRIGRFDGLSHEWVADGIWELVKAEIDQDFPNRVHAYYHPQEEEVWFHYPRIGDSGESLGLAILKLKRPVFNLPYNAAFPGIFGRAISAGVNVHKSGIKVPIVFTSTSSAEKSYTLDGSDDDGVAISSFSQTGFQPLHNAESSRIQEVEPFLERQAGFGTATIKLASSNVLDKPQGDLSAGQSVDLTDIPVRTPLGFDVRARFVALRLEFTSAATVRYRGAIIGTAEGI